MENRGLRIHFRRMVKTTSSVIDEVVVLQYIAAQNYSRKRLDRVGPYVMGISA